MSDGVEGSHDVWDLDDAGSARRGRPLTPDEITKAAERVMRQVGGSREDVSVRAVFAALGRRGSFETINRVLRTWKAGGPQAKAEPRIDLLPEDEARIRDFAVSMLTVVTERARILHQKAVDDLTKSVEEAEKESARILGEMQEQEGELAAARGQVSTLERAVADLKEAVQKLTIERDTARTERDEYKGQAEDLGSTIQAERTRAAQAQGAREQAVADLEVERNARQEAEASARAANEKLAAEQAAFIERAQRLSTLENLVEELKGGREGRPSKSH